MIFVPCTVVSAETVGVSFVFAIRDILSNENDFTMILK